MPRLVEISPEAQRVMLAGFREHKPAAMIARLVEQETGQKVSVTTIGRRKSEWQAEQQRRKAAREQVEDMVAAFRANDFTAEEMISALATEALLTDPAAFSGKDPLKVQDRNLFAQELAIKRKKLDLQERAVAVNEKKLQLLTEKQQRADAAAAELEQKAGRGEQITPDDFRRIREIYGLSA